MSEQPRGEWTSASNALADRLCRGRHQAQIGLPELPPTAEGQSGTVIHALWTGQQPPREPTPDETEKAEALREQETAVVREFFGSREGLVRIVERRLWHEFPVSRSKGGRRILKTSGQFDVVLVHPGSARALICDGKSGWLTVSPNPSNLQLRRLAALLWLQIDSREIAVSILKPLAKPEPPCLYTLADLQRSIAEMEDDVRQSHSPTASRMAGEEQCRYCRAREICTTRLAWLAGALPACWPALPMVSARDWTPAQRALFLEREKAVYDWLQARREEIKILLAESPQSVPGYGLRPGRTLETISCPQEVLHRFTHQFGGTVDRFLECIKVGKAALKDELRVLSGHQGQALEADMVNLLSGCIETKTSAPTIEKLDS